MHNFHNQTCSSYSDMPGKVLEDEFIVEWMAEMGLTASALGMERFGFLPLARQNRILLLGFFITWVSHDFFLCHLFFICFVFFGYPNVSIQYKYIRLLYYIYIYIHYIQSLHIDDIHRDIWHGFLISWTHWFTWLMHAQVEDPHRRFAPKQY